MILDPHMQTLLTEQREQIKRLKAEVKDLKTERAALCLTIHSLEERHARAMALACTDHHIVALQMEVKQERERTAARDQRIADLMQQLSQTHDPSWEGQTSSNPPIDPAHHGGSHV